MVTHLTSFRYKKLKTVRGPCAISADIDTRCSLVTMLRKKFCLNYMSHWIIENMVFRH